GRLASQLRKKRLARKQAGKFVVRNQPVDLLLKLTIYLVKQVEAKQVITDNDLVAVVQGDLSNARAVNERAVCRSQICNPATRGIAGSIQFSGNASVQTRGAGILESDVGFNRAADDDLITLERDRHGHEF